jgi:hypothetical protein
MVSPVGGAQTSSTEMKPRRARSLSRDGVIFDRPSTVVVGPFERSFFSAIPKDEENSEDPLSEHYGRRTSKDGKV